MAETAKPKMLKLQASGTTGLKKNQGKKTVSAITKKKTAAKTKTVKAAVKLPKSSVVKGREGKQSMSAASRRSGVKASVAPAAKKSTKVVKVAAAKKPLKSAASAVRPSRLKLVKESMAKVKKVTKPVSAAKKTSAVKTSAVKTGAGIKKVGAVRKSITLTTTAAKSPVKSAVKTTRSVAATGRLKTKSAATTTKSSQVLKKTTRVTAKPAALKSVRSVKSTKLTTKPTKKAVAVPLKSRLSTTKVADKTTKKTTTTKISAKAAGAKRTVGRNATLKLELPKSLRASKSTKVSSKTDGVKSLKLTTKSSPKLAKSVKTSSATRSSKLKLVALPKPRKNGLKSTDKSSVSSTHRASAEFADTGAKRGPRKSLKTGDEGVKVTRKRRVKSLESSQETASSVEVSMPESESTGSTQSSSLSPNKNWPFPVNSRPL